MGETKPDLALIYKNMFLIWVALFSSQIMFVIVSYVAKPELLKFDFSRPPLGDDPLPVIVFAVLGVLLVGSSFVLKASFYGRAVSEQSPSLVQSGMVIACALCEAASTFGVVLAVSFGYQYFFAFIAMAWAGMAFHFPSRTALMNASMRRDL